MKVDPIFPLGTKVKADGVHEMEYGMIVKTPPNSVSEYDTIVLWDTPEVDDYEEWVGATFLEAADPRHTFKYIDDDGKQINRNKKR